MLPGEPTDGKGKICIHLFVQDEKGLIIEPHVLHEVEDEEGKKIIAKPTKGRLACDSKRLVALNTNKGVTSVTMRTNDPRAVTCPKCIKSVDYQRIMNILQVS